MGWIAEQARLRLRGMDETRTRRDDLTDPTDLATSGDTNTPPVDVRDMMVVHTALLREFRLAPTAVARVPAGAHRQAARVDRHLAFLCGLLHHHHTGEDAHLWPPLRARLPQAALARVENAEAQHAAIEHAMNRVTASRTAWVARPDDSTRHTLISALGDLHAVLAEHLDAEERTILPLAAAYLTEREWGTIGASAMAALPKSAMPLVFGMFSYEGDPAVLATMVSHAPAPARLVVPRIAPWIYARRAERLYGTTKP